MSDHDLNVTFALFGTTVLVLGLVAGAIRNRWHVSEPLLAMGVGVCAMLGMPQYFQNIGMDVLEQAARFTLTIAVVDVALQLPSDYLRRRWKTLLVLLGLVMPLMWVASSLLGWALAGLSLLPAMLLGAIITPTDPVLAGSVATGKLATRAVPARLRHALLAESGANDALAIGFVMLPLSLLGASESRTFGAWLWHVVVVQTLGGIAIGAAAGWLTTRAMGFTQRHDLSREASLAAVAVALAVALLGATKLIGSDGILAAFVAALMLNRSLGGKLEERKREFHETLLRFFMLPIFILFGLLLPWRAWLGLGAAVPAFLFAVFLLRRLPALWLTQRLLPPVERRADMLFSGWFGPIGVAAVYYGALATRKLGDESVWTLASLVVASSVVLHGLSSVLITRWYGRATGTLDREASG